MSITVNTWFITASNCINYTDAFKKSTTIYDIILRYYSKRYYKCKAGVKCKQCQKFFDKFAPKIHILDENSDPLDIESDLIHQPTTNIYIFSKTYTPVLIKVNLKYYDKEFDFTVVYPREFCVQILYDDYLYKKAISFVQKKKNEFLLLYNEHIPLEPDLDEIYLHEIMNEDGNIYIYLKFEVMFENTNVKEIINTLKKNIYKSDQPDFDMESKTKILDSPASEPEFVTDPDPDLEKTSTTSLEGISFDELLSLMKEKMVDFSKPLACEEKTSDQEIKSMFRAGSKKKTSRRKKKKRSGKRSSAYRR
tara:strand:- start:732 stop:1652 length:921 start_codon:yes stop_codon:yes gene_type:complete